MKHRIRALLALAAVLTYSSCMHANVRGGDDPNIRCRLNTPLITTQGGTVTLHFTVTTPRDRDHQRRPMNLAVVIDRSGSMAEENKMEYAKSALAMLVRQLEPEDILSIVMYDDVVEVLRPAGRVRNREQVLALLEQIYPRGSTNLGAGMAEGFRQASRERRAGTVNRVVLISDGLANTGMTDPRALGRIARRHRGESISLTSMGVGLSYNENLMMNLAESGGGNYYFIEHPEQLASIFRGEFQMLSRLYAHNSVIELKLHPSARMRDIIGSSYENKGRTITIPLGDLYYGEDRELSLSVDVDGGSGSVMLASGALAIPAEGKRSSQSLSFTSSLSYTKDRQDVERSRDLEIQAKADILQSTKVVEEALQMFDAGDRDGAQRRLEEAKSALAASPAATQGSGAMKEAIDDQLGRLGSYENEVKDEKGDASRTKKAIQYDNYRAQRKK